MLTFRQGHTYTFNIESIWVDENGTAILVLPNEQQAFAPVPGGADHVVQQALTDLGFQVSLFQKRAPDVAGQSLYACVATWVRPDASVPDTLPCTIGPSSSSYHEVLSWPSGIAFNNVQEYYAGVPMPQHVQGQSVPMQTPQAGQPTPGPGYRGSYGPTIQIPTQQSVYFPGLRR